MGWGQRYRLRYYDLYYNTKWDAHIEINQYSGEVIDLIYNEQPLVFNFPAQEENVFERIKGRSVSISFYNLTYSQYTRDFLESGRRKMRVRVYKNDSLFFIGYYVPDTLSENYLPGPNKVEFEFNDGLGMLRGQKFKISDDEIYTGKKSLMQTIFYCLEKTGLTLDLEESCYFFEENMDSTSFDASPLWQSYHDIDGFIEDDEDITCYEILDRILTIHTARLFQNDGIWNIVPIDNFKHSYEARRYSYNTGGYLYDSKREVDNKILIKGSTNLEDFNGFINLSQKRKVSKTYRNIKITQNYLLKENIVNNNECKYFVQNDHVPSIWTLSGLEIHSRLHKINNFYTTKGINLLQIDSKPSIDIHNFIYQSFKLPDFSDLPYRKIKFTISFISLHPLTLPVQVTLSGSELLTDIYGIRQYHLHKNLDPPVFSNAVENTWMYFIADYEEEADTIAFQNFSFEVEALLPNYGELGGLSIRIGSPFGATGFFTEYIILKNVGIEFLNIYDDFPQEQTQTWSVDPDNEEDFESTINLGDLPSIGLESLVYSGGLYYKNGSYYYPTFSWKRQDEDLYKSMIYLLTEEINLVYNKNRWRLTGQMIGQFDIGARYQTSDGRIFIINELSNYDVKSGIADITLLEIDQNIEEASEGHSEGWMEWTDSSGYVEWTDSSGYVEPTN